MSIEPERPVEKLLRGYARQRREQMGEPPPMHPAMRRQLLSEAARQFGQRQSEDSWWIILKGFWPRVAVGVAGMAILIVSAAIWSSSGSKNSGLQLAKNEGLRSTSSAIALEDKRSSNEMMVAQDAGNAITNRGILTLSSETDAMANLPSASPVDSSPKQQDALAKVAQNKDAAVPTLAAIAPSAPPRDLQEATRDKEKSYGRTAAAPAVSQPLPTSDSLKLGESLEAKTRAETPAELAKAEAAPAQEPVMAFQNTGVNQLFRNQVPVDGQTVPAPAAVMAQFRVEQDGAVVRIIDNDGSIYTGSLQDAEAPTAGKPAPTVTLNAAKSRRALQPPQVSPDQIQNYRLEAIGTNRTLNQKVVFSGNLVGNQISVSATTQNQQALKQNQKLQQQLSNVMRISGKARVGAGTDQLVEAVPLQ